MDVNAVKRRFAKTTILARTVCFSFSAVTSVMLATLFPAVMYAQSARNTSAQAPGSTGGSPNASQSGTAKDGWVVRDPTTGRIFHQQLVPVSVPTVRWENKPITTTLMQPQWVTQVVPESRVAYQSQTQMVLQPYWQEPVAAPPLGISSCSGNYVATRHPDCQ